MDFSHLIPSNNQLNRLSKEILSEIKKAASGKLSSISFYAHPLPNFHRTILKPPTQLMVIGGTNLSTADFNHQNNHLTNQNNITLPALKDIDTFLELIKHHIKPNAQSIALSFAFPLKPCTDNNVLDGYLVSGTKEHSLKGLVGKKVGETISHHLQLTDQQVNVSCANDVVSLAFSSILETRATNLITLIVGTGINAAIIHNHSVINLEVGNFNNFNLSLSAQHIDKHSDDPGKHLLEKEISGAYLYQHYNYYAQKHHISLDKINSTRELSLLVDSSDKLQAQLSQALSTRSAFFTATLITALLIFHKSYVPKIVVEGSLIKDKHYQNLVISKLSELGVANQRLTEHSNSPLEGAASLIHPVSNS